MLLTGQWKITGAKNKLPTMWWPNAIVILLTKQWQNLQEKLISIVKF